MRSGIYPPELRSVNLDSDWLYRRVARRLVESAEAASGAIASACRGAAVPFARGGRSVLERLHGSQGVFARTRSSGSMALGIMLVLLAFLLTYYAS
jgi:multicomponent Na+:H+ antiporter subunit D